MEGLLVILLLSTHEACLWEYYLHWLFNDRLIRYLNVIILLFVFLDGVGALQEIIFRFIYLEQKKNS